MLIKTILKCFMDILTTYSSPNISQAYSNTYIYNLVYIFNLHHPRIEQFSKDGEAFKGSQHIS